ARVKVTTYNLHHGSFLPVKLWPPQHQSLTGLGGAFRLIQSTEAKAAEGPAFSTPYCLLPVPYSLP
ncbi:MAG: hypothetical protein WBW84_09280, partial [Acidobacteriaceae bacterium]